MPMLKCSATTCLYNQEEYCSKGDIVVSGEQAHHADETNCSSFVERSESSMTNSTGCGCEKFIFSVRLMTVYTMPVRSVKLLR